MSQQQPCPPAPAGQFDLPQTMRRGWVAYEIVYTCYKVDPTDPAGRRIIVSTSSHVIEGDDIRGFIKARVDGDRLPSPARIRSKNPADTAAHKPLNTYVGGPCYVVFELESGPNWQFQPGRPAVTTDKDYGIQNGALEHVMANGDLAGPCGPSGDGCRLVYFGVNSRTKFQHPTFFCHLEFEPSAARDETQIDPDVPNDGGKFPVPMFPDVGEDSGA
jgi:hypothetical protein